MLLIAIISSLLFPNLFALSLPPLFTVNGVVKFQGYATKQIDGDYVTIRIGVIEKRQLSVREGKYNTQLPMTHFQELIKLEANLEPYVQIGDPIEFTPAMMPPRRRYAFDFVIILLHKKNRVEDLLYEASRIKNSEPDRAIELIDESISLDPQPRAYNYKIRIIHEIAKGGRYIPLYLLRDIESIEQSEHFKGLSNEFKFNFYLQLGKAILEVPDLNKNIDPIETYGNIGIKTFQKTINVDSSDARGYQGKYTAEKEMGLYSDEIETIKSFFANNSNIQNEQSIITFISEWIIALKELTGYPKGTEQEYIKLVSSNTNFKNKWQNINVILTKYRSVYQERTGRKYDRLNNAKSLAKKIINGEI